nr:immunoglobulin heavy chain junction region [Macaca mulatta]
CVRDHVGSGLDAC